MPRAVPAVERDAQRLVRNALKGRNAAAAAATGWGRMPLVSAKKLNSEMMYITGFHEIEPIRVMNDS